MKVTPTSIADILVIEPRVFGDDRGFFMETYNQRDLARETGLSPVFVQDNHSLSGRHVLRGLHYQLQQPQGKLVRVISGEIFDVAVDIRKSSVAFGQWAGVRLSAENKKQLWVPEGFAHGFLVLSETAEVIYKTTDYYNPQTEHCIAWNDPDLDIEWPLDGMNPDLSEKDQQGDAFKSASYFD